MKTYDPRKVKVNVGTFAVLGMAKGTFVKASFNSDAFTHEKGSKGEGVRTLSADDSGEIEITIQGTSPTNRDFSNLAKKDREDGSGVVAVSIEDLNGETLWESTESWVKKPADLEYADEHTPRTWIITCDSLKWFTDGSAA